MEGGLTASEVEERRVRFGRNVMPHDRWAHLRPVIAVVKEPMGGAHRDPKIAIEKVGDAIEAALVTLDGMSADDLRAQRKERFYAIGREGLA